MTHNWIWGKVQLGKGAEENSHFSEFMQPASLSGELGTGLWPVVPTSPPVAPCPRHRPHVASSHSPELKATRMLQSSFLERTQDSCFSDPGALARGPCSCLRTKQRQAGARERTERTILSEICSHSQIQQTSAEPLICARLPRQNDSTFRNSYSIQQTDRQTSRQTR